MRIESLGPAPRRLQLPIPPPRASDLLALHSDLEEVSEVIERGLHPPEPAADLPVGAWRGTSRAMEALLEQRFLTYPWMSRDLLGV